jgi:hypothetical protein
MQYSPQPACAAQTTSSLNTPYWLGLVYNNDTFLYEWLGGDDAGSGPPGDYPYAHFVYNWEDLRRAYPDRACTAAVYGRSYDRYACGPSFVVACLLLPLVHQSAKDVRMMIAGISATPTTPTSRSGKTTTRRRGATSGGGSRSCAPTCCGALMVLQDVGCGSTRGSLYAFISVANIAGGTHTTVLPRWAMSVRCRWRTWRARPARRRPRSPRRQFSSVSATLPQCVRMPRAHMFNTAILPAVGALLQPGLVPLPQAPPAAT